MTTQLTADRVSVVMERTPFDAAQYRVREGEGCVTVEFLDSPSGLKPTQLSIEQAVYYLTIPFKRSATITVEGHSVVLRPI